MWKIKLEVNEVKCYFCNKKAIALQDDKPVCLKHYSKIQHMSEGKHVR